MALNPTNLAVLLKALAHEKRLNILFLLKKHKTMTVGDLAEATQQTDAATSQHLRILRNAGIVEHKQRGKFVTYRLALKQEHIVHSILYI